MNTILTESINPYPNSYYVEKYIGSNFRGTGWYPLMTSVGRTKAYAQGYLEACDSFQPHDGYRLIDKAGKVVEERQPRGPMKVNSSS